MTYNVDMRGEVALLTRNIQIEGEMEERCYISNGNCNNFLYDTFGGHLKFVRGFENVHLEGVELYHMGQQTEKVLSIRITTLGFFIGYYPVHFHMCHDVDGVGNYSHPPYFRDSTVHHSFSRCVTVHGTSGVTVQDNVCYDSLGHSYFLEDGGEKRNLLDGNIGLSTKKGKILKSDSRPATYWMTNPINSLRNNVAAGSEAYGIWYVFPDEPYGPSFGKDFMQKYEAMHTPILEFDNNVAHSNEDTGLFADNKVLQSSDATGSNEYSPRIYPMDPNSPPASVNFTRPTLYKNRRGNMFLRGGWLRVDRGSFADSSVGATFAKSDDQQQFLYNSVFLGESKNIGEPHIGMSRSLPDPDNIHTHIEGFSFYDGPVYVENSWFSNFIRHHLYPVGAVGFNRNDQNPSSAVSSVMGVKFGFDDDAQGNRVYHTDTSISGFSDHDGDDVATVRDIDGSLTGYVGSQLVRPTDFNINAGCYVRTNWNMAICPQSYGKLTIQLESEADRGKTSPFAVRDDKPTVKETRDSTHPAQFLTILGGDYSYTINWSNYVPHQFSIRGEGIEHGKWVRFGVCLPRDVMIDITSYKPKYLGSIHDWTLTQTLDDLEADTVGDKYFWDSYVGLLFFKFMNYNTRTINDTTECPGSGCPEIKITVTGGNTLDADCTQRAYNGAYNRNAPTEKVVLKQIDLPASLAAPTSSMGAGETRPFGTRRTLDGKFGRWTDWTPCSKNCLGENQYRYRSCNQPIPQNGGRNCVGNAVDSRKCDQRKCTRRDGRSIFRRWSRCRRTGGRHGVQTRRRRLRRNEEVRPR
ncbi:hypothetical protein LOTGIDRAFT_228687 [Lottia gigantea]|uniref:G8 domain-containing protein n=1 Tax=Lottia gigantea TaxID=225164 RepID=V3ZRI4_LOTGI|nr:hypothetical protein LOTGIDRAFT_228687 [Lottia gigantea]ESO94033.1 hypothetical protein LOTGIDRAFT_228687 [Lottia gigantea]